MINNMDLDLQSKEWQEFIFEDIFNIDSSSSSIDKNKLNKKLGDTPYVTRSEKNNGYDSFIGEQAKNYNLDEGNVITIGLDTQTVFYQPKAFYTGQNIQVLRSKYINKDVAQFLIPLIIRQMDKFNWGGNGATLTRLRRSKILLPIDSKSDPDYAYMETYMSQAKQYKIDKYRQFANRRLSALQNYKDVGSLENKEWGEFEIKDVAEIESGRDIYERERVSGNTPYVSATANNNGIGYFVDNTNNTKEAGCLSVNRNGSVGYAFYHPYVALFSNDCRKLRLKQPSKHIGIFIAQQITRQRAKYGYGYKMGTARLKRQKIMLPINQNNEPDYKFMENFMKRLEYKKLAEYISYKRLNESNNNIQSIN